MRQSTHLSDRARHRLDVAVLDAEQRQSLVAVRSFGQAGLRVGVFERRRAPAFSSRWCSAIGLVPDCATDGDRFVEGVLDLIEKHSPRVVTVAHDGTIEAIRTHRDEFEDRTVVALADEDALRIAVDKATTYDVADSLGIAVPRTVTVDDPNEFGAAVDEVGFPLVIKPTRSWVQQGITGERLTAESAITLEQARAALEHVFAAGGSAVVQQWVGGRREAVSVVYAGGHFCARFAQVAHRMFPPLGGSSILRESIPLPADLVASAEALVTAVGLEGYCEVEFRRDGRGNPFLMEINPRLSASVELAVRAGIDFPALVYAWAIGAPVTVRAYRTGVRMRWLGGDIRWLRRTLQTRGLPDSPSPGLILRTFARDTLRPTHYDYLVRSDLRPAVTATVDFLRHASSRVRDVQNAAEKAGAIP